MPPKARTPAPIDRPLSRAYLREFTGWSTAYPPGISDPTSLRVMENMQINRDGSVRVRPGLRYLSYESSGGVLQGIARPVVGSHEPFFMADGSKAYLFAVRETDNSVGFRVLTRGGTGMLVQTLAGAGFTVSAGLNFTAATTYVKYLQIDNKVFALSNAGETMRWFSVGASKAAKPLNSVTRPNWNVGDKLTVVQPDAAWLTTVTPSTLRTNRIVNPNMAILNSWVEGSSTVKTRLSPGMDGTGHQVQLTSKPQKTNLVPNPIRNASAGGIGGWGAGSGTSALAVSGVSLAYVINAGAVNRVAYINGPNCIGVEPGRQYRFAYNINALPGGCNQNTLKVRWYTTTGAQVGSDIDLLQTVATGRVSAALTAPAGAYSVRMYPGFGMSGTGLSSTTRLNDFLITDEVTTTPNGFDGGSGTNYFWTGAPYDSASVYHPPADVLISTPIGDTPPGPWCGSIYTMPKTTARSVTMTMNWINSSGTVLSAPANTSAQTGGTWTRATVATTAPAGTVRAWMGISIPAVPRGEAHFFDSALFEEGTTPGAYFDGSMPSVGTTTRFWNGDTDNSTSTEGNYTVGGSLPAAETKTVNTLISSTSSANQYNFAFFYTFNNEVGESAASQVTVVRAQRGWSAWRWETANAAGEPSGTDTGDPGLAADQLVAYMPNAVFDAALAQGATGWNLYMATWSDQDPVPVTALRVGHRDLVPGLAYSANAWLRATPQMGNVGDETASIPSTSNRRNYSDPSRGGQGLVAADRMVMVNDPTAPAVIRWTSNNQGAYTDFSAGRGGGYKTLTSGNLFVPACVKLWQNPQSADTLTILCMGVDGYSTGYYMAPAQVASQSEAVNVMGFEETTATPGTVSPYGVEVMNNALYHPLDEQLMKSTATNYNINHKSQTDLIQNMWRELQFKQRIVSSQHDARIYYLVYNPSGAPLEADCWGNEVWVFDSASTAGTWSRWLAQGKSLRRIEQGGDVVMSLVRPDGIFYFDESYDRDDVVDPTTKVISQRFIAWKLETNTQGANRAHDAWAHVQQCNIVLGNFQGQMRYGLRALNIHGQRVDIHKTTRDTNDPATGATPMFDLEDQLQVRHDLREWFFYAESLVDDAGVTQWGYGQIDLVQYRYTPSTVNTGYEFGSIETFEYQRAAQPLDNRTTDNGVPMPFVDTGRP